MLCSVARVYAGDGVHMHQPKCVLQAPAITKSDEHINIKSMEGVVSLLFHPLMAVRTNGRKETRVKLIQLSIHTFEFIVFVVLHL